MSADLTFILDQLMNLILWTLIPLALLLGYVIGARTIYRFQNHGEVLVRQSLMNCLPANSWHLLNNVTLSLDKGTTQIDHVLVSRFGVFVIETKHYKGWIFGDGKSKSWTQVLFQRKHRFQNPLHQNYKHVKAVQAALDFVPPEQVIGLVVFTGDSTFKTTPPAGVHTLRSLMTYLKGQKIEVLTENRMQFCVGRLECTRLALTRQTDVEHRANIEGWQRG
jgi:restriction system protein